MTGRRVDVVENPQHAGAAGAAACCALALGIHPDFPDVARSIRVWRSHLPQPSLRDVYERNYRLFQRLYSTNRKNFSLASRLCGPSYRNP